MGHCIANLSPDSISTRSYLSFSFIQAGSLRAIHVQGIIRINLCKIISNVGPVV